MKFVLAFIFLTCSALATDWTEFYVQSTGSNLNAGHQAAADTGAVDNTATYTGVGDSDGTSIFTPSDGSTPASTVSAGDFASVYVTAGATVATFVGRVTAVAGGANGAITVSTTAKAGTFPASSAGAHTITCKIGGAWAGPSGAVDFPIGFAAGTLMNATGNKPRVNFKGDGDNSTADYSITAGMTADTEGIVLWQGYTTTPGDGGKANIDGGTSGTYYTLLTVTVNLHMFADLIFSNNGASGTAADGIYINVQETYMYRCVVHDIAREGIRMAVRGALVECEVYACNETNTSPWGGIGLRGDGCMAFRCISHDNPGSFVDGFISDGSGLVECISETNGRHGFNSGGDKSIYYLSCDAYNNGGDGIKVGTGSGSMLANIQNCNLVKNAGWGINFVASTQLGTLYHCGFGRGTQVNTGGDYSTLLGVDVILTNLGSGSADGRYADNVTPWQDPASGDFRISLAAAKNAGRGAFTQTSGSYTGTIGYPDIGAGQSQPSAGGGASLSAGTLNLGTLNVQ